MTTHLKPTGSYPGVYILESDKKQLSKSFNDVSKIIHLAYINGTKHFYERPEQVLDVAVKGLINILLFSIIIMVAYLALISDETSIIENLRISFFNVISVK